MRSLFYFSFNEPKHQPYSYNIYLCTHENHLSLIIRHINYQYNSNKNLMTRSLYFNAKINKLQLL